MYTKNCIYLFENMFKGTKIVIIGCKVILMISQNYQPVLWVKVVK